ncbi:hypothetical protein HYZ06_01505 [Candidatus Daviesbacteria bacterium]|nr:hypothetical protein [Candidatus Daviesbacteria bacterium]
MSGKIIATIYFYVISAASLALIVIGIFNTVNFIINSTQYEKYPLRYPQGSCENYPFKFGPYPAMDVRGMPATPSATLGTGPSAQELEKQKQDCLKQENALSKQQKIDDLKNAITFTLVGLVLFSIHFPLARKQSKS